MGFFTNLQGSSLRDYNLILLKDTTLTSKMGKYLIYNAAFQKYSSEMERSGLFNSSHIFIQLANVNVKYASLIAHQKTKDNAYISYTFAHLIVGLMCT